MNSVQQKLILSFIFSTSFLLTFKGYVRAQGTWSSEVDSGYFWGGVCLSTIPINGAIYVLGFDSLQILDVTSQKWTTPPEASTYLPVTDYSNADVGFEMGTACEVNGKIYCFGGFYDNAGSPSVPDSMHVFDPISNSWSVLQTSGTYTSREDVLGAVVNGKIYAIGGNNGYLSAFPQYRSTIEIFDPASNTWTTPVTNGSLVPGIGQTASVVNGKIYVIGGIAYDTNALPNPPNQVFDPATNTWSNISSTGFEQRWYHSAAVMDGKIYIVGGAPVVTIVPGGSGYILQIYDPSTDTWRTPPTTGTFTPRSMLASAVLGGKIYAIGGRISHDVTNIVEVFTPDTSSLDVSANEYPSCALHIFPNPASSELQITGSQSGTVHLFDLLGRERMGAPLVGNSATLEVSSLPPGLYFVSDGHSQTKFIKN